MKLKQLTNTFMMISNWKNFSAKEGRWQNGGVYSKYYGDNSASPARPRLPCQESAEHPPMAQLCTRPHVKIAAASSVHPHPHL